jgi:endonuclease YncB( thermonuclease family)
MLSKSKDVNYNLEKLKMADKTNTPIFSLNGFVTFAKAVDFYDGDTFNIIISYYDLIYHFKARMFGYDSPEMKPSLSTQNRDEIKKNATCAKNRLVELIGNKEYFRVYCHEFDKYGRLLVSIFKDDDDVDASGETNYDFNKTINKQMIDEGHGYSYYGGTKQNK